MSAIAITSSGSGAGTLSIAAPITATNRTLTLPDATTTLVGTDATQTLTNKTIQGGAITSGTTVASTSGTSIDFTGIPSWAKRVTVMLSGVTTNSTSNPLFQIGGASIETTTYSGSGSLTSAAGAQAANFTTGFGLVLNVATYDMNGSIVFSLIDSATNTWSATGCFGSSTVIAVWFTAGKKAITGALQRVRMTTVGGTATFNAGSINILYEG